MKDFKLWEENLVGGVSLNEDFILRFKHTLEEQGVKYSILSSSKQLTNGTLVISLRLGSEELVEEVVKEWGLRGKIKDLWVNTWPGKINIHVSGTTHTRYLADYIVYSKGSVRMDGVSSDALKFNPNTECEKAAKWIVENFKTQIIKFLSRFALKNPGEFLDLKKTREAPVEVEKLKEFFTPHAWNHLQEMEKAYPGILKQVGTDILQLCFLSLVSKHKKLIAMNDSGDSSYFFYCATGSNTELKEKYLSFEVKFDIKIPKTKKKIEIRMSKSMGSTPNAFPSGKSISFTTYAPSFQKLASEDYLPGWMEFPLAELSKKQPEDLRAFAEKVLHDHRGSIAGHDYGI